MRTVVPQCHGEEAQIRRKAREFWAITDWWTVERVVGWECPKMPDVWWVPKLGYSLSIGHHIFDEKDQAVEQCRKKLKAELARLAAALEKLGGDK